MSQLLPLGGQVENGRGDETRELFEFGTAEPASERPADQR
jgi:hypothetical protein